MTKRLDSDALALLNRVLGLAGGNASQTTELDDGNVSQTLDISAVVRRSRTFGVGGWFHCILDNIHAAAGFVQSTIDPYNVGVLARNGYPAIIPAAYDVWLLSTSLMEVGAGGGLDGGVLLNNTATTQQGWGRNSAGATVGAGGLMAMARWTGLDSSITTVEPHGISGDGSSSVHILQRVPRRTTVIFRTDAAAAATFRCFMVIGLFSEALGQDIAQ